MTEHPTRQPVSATVVLLALVALGLLVGGLAAGFLPVSGEVRYTTVACGSAFSPDDSQARDEKYAEAITNSLAGAIPDNDDYLGACQDARSPRFILGLAGVGLGLVVGSLAMLVRATERRGAP